MKKLGAVHRDDLLLDDDDDDNMEDNIVYHHNKHSKNHHHQRHYGHHSHYKHNKVASTTSMGNNLPNISGCPIGLGVDDGHTIADKTRHYKLCNPVYGLPVCR